MALRFLYLCFLALFTITGIRAEDAPLADALENKDRQTALQLIKSKKGINTTQADGMSPLHWATYHDDTELALQLLESGAKADLQNRYGVAPIYSACQNGNVKIVQALLKRGVDPNTSLKGEEAILTAARTGSPEVIKALLDAGARVNAYEHRQQTALMWAAAEGNLDAVKVLIDAGADIHKSLESGYTPLLFAVREGHQEVVHELLKAGIDINHPAKPKKGRLPNGSTPLTLAIENGHFTLAASLLKAGANANDMRTGYSPLHILSWVRKPDGGDAPDDLPPPDGSGPISSLQFAQVLVDHGAQINARLKGGKSDWKGATPFYLAAWTADLGLMRKLVELGADPLINSTNKSTPLMAATGIGRKMEDASAGTEEEILASAKYLLDLGVAIDAVNTSGETAMHGAAYKNLPAVITYLDQQNADPKIWHKRNKRGSTPYLIAAGYRPGNFKPSYETMAAIKKVLDRHGIEPNETPPKKVDPYAKK